MLSILYLITLNNTYELSNSHTFTHIYCWNYIQNWRPHKSLPVQKLIS